MKRVILIGVLATTFGFADIIGGEIDLGYYSHSPSGTAQNGDDSVDIEKDLHWQDESEFFAKAYIEHPIPILPNIKLGYSKFSHEGDGIASKTFSWGDIQYITLKDRVYSNLDLDIFDLTLYYEILDNWLNLDVGLNVKYLDGSIEVETTTSHDKSDINIPIPMLYSKARVDIPTTDLSFQLEGNYVSYDNNTLYDFEAGIRYTFALGFGVEGGYKAMKIKIDDVDDTSMDADFNGAYAKVYWDF